jgi:hypothetical protein
MSRFSPNFVSMIIVKPLRYFFTNYAGPDLKYSEDPKETKIDISSVNNYNKIELQEKPRILVDRGGYQISNTGLSDNMAEALPMDVTFGLDKRTNMVFINGQASITIEARNEGTCELVTDMVSHFLVWTKPYICNSQGFKNFAVPMSVSPCTPSKEDTEIFQVVISVPYLMEELWQVQNDALKINGFIQSLTI